MEQWRYELDSIQVTGFVRQETLRNREILDCKNMLLAAGKMQGTSGSPYEVFSTDKQNHSCGSPFLLQNKLFNFRFDSYPSNCLSCRFHLMIGCNS